MRPCRDGVPAVFFRQHAGQVWLVFRHLPSSAAIRPLSPCHRRYIDLMLEVRATQGTGGAYIALKAAGRAIFHFQPRRFQPLPPDHGDSGVRAECALWPRCCTAFDGREDVRRRLTMLLQKQGPSRRRAPVCLMHREEATPRRRRSNPRRPLPRRRYRPAPRRGRSERFRRARHRRVVRR